MPHIMCLAFCFSFCRDDTKNILYDQGSFDMNVPQVGVCVPIPGVTYNVSTGNLDLSPGSHPSAVVRAFQGGMRNIVLRPVLAKHSISNLQIYNISEALFWSKNKHVRSQTYH